MIDYRRLPHDISPAQADAVHAASRTRTKPPAPSEAWRQRMKRAEELLGQSQNLQRLRQSAEMKAYATRLAAIRLRSLPRPVERRAIRALRAEHQKLLDLLAESLAKIPALSKDWAQTFPLAVIGGGLVTLVTAPSEPAPQTPPPAASIVQHFEPGYSTSQEIGTLTGLGVDVDQDVDLDTGAVYASVERCVFDFTFESCSLVGLFINPPAGMTKLTVGFQLDVAYDVDMAVSASLADLQLAGVIRVSSYTETQVERQDIFSMVAPDAGYVHRVGNHAGWHQREGFAIQPGVTYMIVCGVGLFGHCLQNGGITASADGTVKAIDLTWSA